MQKKKEEKVPLPGTFMIISIVGFLISLTYTISGQFSDWFMFMGENTGNSFGFVFTLVFLLMFISAVISMTPSFDDLE